MNKISVVIPVKNEEEKIERCLEAVFSQSLKPHEVIVVDGHLTGRAVEGVREFPVKVVYEDYGAVDGARQAGVLSAESEIVAFTDADCIPEKNWLENLVKEFDDGIVGVGGGLRNTGEEVWEKSIALALDSFLGSTNSVQDRVFKEKKLVKSISGCNSVYYDIKITDKPISVGWIRERADKNEFQLTGHAHKERQEGTIKAKEISDALVECEMLENYPDDPRGASFLVSGLSGGRTNPYYPWSDEM